MSDKRPDTQMQAWQAIQESLPDKRRMVFSEVMARVNGLTLFELENILNWPVNRISGRITELCKAGHIMDSGRRRINPDSGKGAVVWIAVRPGSLF